MGFCTGARFPFFIRFTLFLLQTDSEFGLGDEGREGCVQGCGDAFQILEAHIVAPVLKVAHVGGVHTDDVGELLLREARFQTAGADDHAEFLLQRGFHARTVGL